ncbi:MAG TPA: MraY family glycosyltransferase [Bacteroidales bacterium]|nr:MraY family glycosyltransferase [Bacteroidales bacterium]
MQYTPLLVFLTSFIVSLVSLPSIIKVANEKALFDKPSEKRKIHTKSTPNLGGVAIFLGFYFSILMFRVLCDSVELSALCAASVLLFFVALKDDLISTAPILRLFFQFLIAFIIVMVGQVYFYHLPFFESDGIWAVIINMIVTMIFIVASINAMNFIDGIDGLAGLISFVVFIIFGAVFYQYGENSYAFLSLSLAGSTLGFLIFNWNPAKIFMGDIGSMLLGVFMAVLAIKLCNMEPLRLGLITIKNPTTLALALLIVPLMDMITVISIRFYLRISPFFADKRHTHHRLLGLGMNQKAVTLTLVGFNLLMVAVALITGCLPGIISSVIVLLLAAAFETTIIYLYLKQNKADHSL